MTMPSGLLEWGQTGTYDAVDDRMVITALSGGVTGIVKSAVLTAGSGLNVSLAGGWLAVASCADGTNAVVGSREPTQFAVAAGGSSARVDYLWCDVSPDTAQWSLALIGANDIAGRSGVLLATISVPANGSAASGFTFATIQPTFGSPDFRTSVLTTAVTFTGNGDTANSGTTIANMATVPSSVAARYVVHGLVQAHKLAGAGRFGIGFQVVSGITVARLVVQENYGDGTGVAVYGWGGSIGNARRISFTGHRSMTSGTYFRIYVDGVLTIAPTAAQPLPPAITFYINADRGAQVSLWDGSYCSVEKFG